MANNSAWSILVGVELDTNAKKIQEQLDKVSKNTTVNLDTKQAKKNVDSLASSVEDLGLTYQAANAIMQTSLDIISSMIEQTFKLDTALTEFKKVSDLSGTALDEYTQKLSEMGRTVARTGKPKCLAPDNGIENQYLEPLEIQYSLIAYSATMVS